MRKYIRLLTVILLAVLVSAPLDALAIEGTLGYEGGISAENKTVKDEYRYSETCFLTGRPIVMTGTLTIKKTDKNDVVNATYTYRLENAEHDATLNRVVMYTTSRETKSNGQITENTKLSRTPTEVLNIGGTTYRLSEAAFSRSLITDPKAAINYHAGEFSSRKTYNVGVGPNADTVTVSMSGRLYAYDQHWSSTQTQKINVLVETDINSSPTMPSWGGTAEIVVSSATLKQIKYSENEPTLISFDGGYVQSSWTESALDYTARFPEFDKDGNATDVIKTYADTLSLSAPVELSRLMVPDIKHLNGYWAEEPISILFGLEIIPGTGDNFKVGKYLTRREFVVLLMRTLRDIPEDPNVRTSRTPARKPSNKKAPEVSPFRDVNTEDEFYEEIKQAYQKGITRGDGKGNFYPNTYITRAEAVKMIVAALGLENLAPWPYTATPFADNDAIPAYARNAASVANSLGLVMPDERGRFNPSARMTNENTADMLYGLINYMGDELVRDYRDRIMAY